MISSQRRLGFPKIFIIGIDNQDIMFTNEEMKIHNHLIDYIDMENQFIELLKMEEVKDDIRSTYRYIFVDEFQDSSPVQVQIFDLLSEIVGRDEDDNQLVKIGDPGKEKDF